MSMLEAIREVRKHEWPQVSSAGVAGVFIFSAIILYFSDGGERWVFILGSANAAFHEFGHPFFGIVHEDFRVIGGTLGQLIYPVAVTAAFWLRREPVSFAVGRIWFFESFFNISRYLATARSLDGSYTIQLGPDGEGHDWREMFSLRYVLNSNTRNAAAVSFLGFLGIAASCLWLLYRWRSGREQDNYA